MKRSELKQSIKEEIIDILDEASKEDIENQKELNKELEKTAKLAADLAEGNDSDKFMDDGYVDHKYDDETIDKYNIPVEPTAVFEEDASDADRVTYIDIGSGYLQGFNRPHSLNKDELETLGRKIVSSLYKGDIDRAVGELTEDEDEPSSKDIKASSKDSISKIASKLQQISSEMKSTAKKWKSSEGEEKMKLRDRLVKLTKIKKELESLL